MQHLPQNTCPTATASARRYFNTGFCDSQIFEASRVPFKKKNNHIILVLGPSMRDCDAYDLQNVAFCLKNCLINSRASELRIIDTFQGIIIKGRECATALCFIGQIIESTFDLLDQQVDGTTLAEYFILSKPVFELIHRQMTPWEHLNLLMNDCR
jgi:hypothetical protein